MVRIKWLIGLFLFFSVSIPVAFGCQPCQEQHSLSETIEASDMIAIGFRSDPGASKDPMQKQPEMIKFTIQRVIKGTPYELEIQVKSFSGMCPYGIVLGEQQSLVILKKTQPGNPKSPYEAVFGDCGARTFPVKDGMIEMNGALVAPWHFLKKAMEYGS